MGLHLVIHRIIPNNYLKRQLVVFSMVKTKTVLMQMEDGYSTISMSIGTGTAFDLSTRGEAEEGGG